MLGQVQRMMDRRKFVHGATVFMAHVGLFGCRRNDEASRSPDQPRTSGLGSGHTRQIVLDGMVEIPAGFHAIVIQREGDEMSDGYRVAAQPDGMTCHVGPDGTWILLRNHELGDGAWVDTERIAHSWFSKHGMPAGSFAEGVYGGVSRVVLDPNALRGALSGRASGVLVRSSNAVLAGTDRNCAGGSIEVAGVKGWVSCEESDSQGHGWAFLTRIDDEVLVRASDRRLESWGRFKREAVALDVKTGVVWMTEDHENGLFYRHVPADPAQPFGSGRLEALQIEGVTHTDPHFAAGKVGVAKGFSPGTSWSTSWVRIEDPAAVVRRCRDQGSEVGATRFNRAEGMTFDPNRSEVYFIASTAGPLAAGQIFKYSATTEKLVLVAQVDDRRVLSMPDNVTLSPWGDLVMAEDNYDRKHGATSQFVRGMTPEGRVYDILRNPQNAPHEGVERPPGAEFAGCCFSPDGEVLFVNIQSPQNVTLAITGDWAALAAAPAKLDTGAG